MANIFKNSKYFKMSANSDKNQSIDLVPIFSMLSEGIKNVAEKSNIVISEESKNELDSWINDPEAQKHASNEVNTCIQNAFERLPEMIQNFQKMADQINIINKEIENKNAVQEMNTQGKMADQINKEIENKNSEQEMNKSGDMDQTMDQIKNLMKIIMGKKENTQKTDQMLDQAFDFAKKSVESLTKK